MQLPAGSIPFSTRVFQHISKLVALGFSATFGLLSSQRIDQGPLSNTTEVA